MVSVGTLIDAAELRELLHGAHPPVVLDVRWSLGGPPTRACYLAGHVPTAVWVDLDSDLSDPPGVHGRHPLPEPGRLEQALRGWGIDDDSTVVAYDSGDMLPAARAWWVLRWAGVADVRVLDGGLPTWVAAGGAMIPGDESPRAGSVRVRPGGMPLLGVEDVARLASTGVLLDARSAERFRGDVEPIDRVAGHIPGARSLPSADDLGPDGRMRSAEWLRERYGTVGADAAKGDAGLVGAYCGSGVTAARTVLALELAGVRAALYAGSWSEWIADPSRPVATGP